MMWVHVEPVTSFPTEAGDAGVFIDARFPVIVVWILDSRIGAPQAKALEAKLNKLDRISDMDELGRVLAASLASETAGATGNARS